MRLCLWQPTQTDLLLSVSLDRGPPSPSAILPRASSLWRRKGKQSELPAAPPAQAPTPALGASQHTSAAHLLHPHQPLACPRFHSPSVVLCLQWLVEPPVLSLSSPHPTSLSSFPPPFSLSAPSPPSGCQRLPAHILDSPAEENHMTGTVNQNHTFLLKQQDF